jgi:transposase-like protein
MIKDHKPVCPDCKLLDVVLVTYMYKKTHNFDHDIESTVPLYQCMSCKRVFTVGDEDE